MAGSCGKRLLMESIKIIFFDIDGTLVDHATGKISEKTREAVKRLGEKGMLLAIATGRPSASLPDFGDLRFDAFCAFNGSLCYTPTEVIHSNPIPPASVRKVLENTNAIGKAATVAAKDRMAANGYSDELAGYYALAGRTLTVAEDFDEVSREDVFQIMVGCRAEDHPAVTAGVEGIKLAISWDRAVDVIPATSGKGASILKILEYYGLEPSQAMAFGDSYNDLELLQTVGTGVAMGNAPADLKAVADDVCGAVSEDGIYHYCLDHGLI